MYDVVVRRQVGNEARRECDQVALHHPKRSGLGAAFHYPPACGCACVVRVVDAPAFDLLSCVLAAVGIVLMRLSTRC
jgi:hypothetical protein